MIEYLTPKDIDNMIAKGHPLENIVKWVKLHNEYIHRCLDAGLELKKIDCDLCRLQHPKISKACTDFPGKTGSVYWRTYQGKETRIWLGKSCSSKNNLETKTKDEIIKRLLKYLTHIF